MAPQSLSRPARGSKGLSYLRRKTKFPQFRQPAPRANPVHEFSKQLPIPPL